MKILLIGLSHKTAPIEVRECLAFTPAMLRSALTHFGTIHPQAHLEDVREGVLLSTCNRLEVYALVRNPKVATVVVANRTYDSAAQLARAWGGKAIVFQQLPAALAKADIVITATGAPHTILNQALLEPAIGARPDRPLFIFDIAVPRDVDPTVSGLPNVHLHDIDDLQGQAGENVRERESEIPRVEMIVAEEVNRFLEWLSSLEASSTITELRRKIEQLQQRERSANCSR